MKNLKQLRENKGVSQQTVADYLQVSRQAYNFYENNKREPDFETLLKLGEFFDVSVDYLLRGKIRDGELEQQKTPPAKAGSVEKQRILEIIDLLPDEALPRAQQILEAAFPAESKPSPK